MSMGGSMTGMHRINDKVFDAARIDETIAVNSTENWVGVWKQGNELTRCIYMLLNSRFCHGAGEKIVEL